ncbi:MAG: hypothetical protein ACR2PA_19215 [Hyphomicrobiaceae bacterium]
MVRRSLIALCAVALGATAVAAQDGRVTRIEPRPFYGAIVSVEEGVRVFRPLPPHKTIIIDPGQKTPVNLKFVNAERSSPAINNNVRVDTRIIRRAPRVTIPVNKPIH